MRTEVFVSEQRVAAELEWDGEDGAAFHALVTNRLGQPLATGRLLHAGPGRCRIGRMAVSQTLRGSGIGRSVLDALLGEAVRRGAGEVVLHAQVGAEPFYRRAGFAPHGEVFEEAGLAPHRDDAPARLVLD